MTIKPSLTAHHLNTDISARSLVDLYQHNEDFIRLQAGIDQIHALEALLRKHLPDYLVSHVRAGLIQHATLPLFTPHSACAARLHHLSPHLIQAFQHHGWTIDAVKVRIRPAFNETRHPCTRKKQPLSEIGQSCLQQLRELFTFDPHSGRTQK